MRAAIYNPYWDTLGGGERYAISVADVLSRSGYKVDIAWSDAGLIKQIDSRFGLKLKNINIVPDINKGRDYDVCFWVSDGSIPLLYARKNILHFQIPFTLNQSFNLMNKMKFARVRSVVCNSQFTKKFIDKSFGIDSNILYPPVDVKKFKTQKKEKSILYVGRFSKLIQAKRQDILIESFKSLYDLGAKDWKLILAGGVEVGVGDYLDELRALSKGYPVSFIQSPTFAQIQKLYATSAIFWSAAGYGVDENKNPKLVEHFGMTLVEAMAAKCVPLVYNAGGFKEIINNGENGFLWNKRNDLAYQTRKLIKDKEECQKIAKQAQMDSEKYSYDHFEKTFLSIL